MKNSAIEWTDHTFNPWEGCTKVSHGCAHCYAEARNKRFLDGVNWGPGAPRRRTSKHNWSEPRRWNRDAAGSAQRPRVFCASLADWLDDEVPIEWLHDLLVLIMETPHLDWLLLTKRPQNFRPRLEAVYGYASEHHDDALCVYVICWLNGKAPANVWLGTSVENQEYAGLRIPRLLRIPARVRFLSCEPLIGHVSLQFTSNLAPIDCRAEWLEYIDWVICGGESGPNARPMNPAWARSLRDQCTAASVAFFFKQWGEYLPAGQDGALIDGTQHINASDKPERVGKKLAGRQLDGREWSQFPEVRA